MGTVTEQTIDSRRKYIEEFKDTVDRHRERAFEYESKAIDFANNAFRVLTYLNGGALVAIPTAVALFQADIAKVKLQLVYGAAFFIAGLICIVAAQGAAFFTMARRSESEIFLQYEQMVSLGATHFPQSPEQQTKLIDEAKEFHTNAVKKITRSNYWRRAGLIMFWISLGAFIFGSFFGARAILG